MSLRTFLAAAPLAQGANIKISSPAIPQQNAEPILRFVRLKGQDSLSSLFEYQIECQTPDHNQLSPSVAANLDLASLIGQPLSIQIELPNLSIAQQIELNTQTAQAQEHNPYAQLQYRAINGIITQAAYSHQEGTHHIYSITLRPWLWLATQNNHCRIFQQQTVVDIIKALLADYPYSSTWRLNPQDYPRREYQVQYQESDYQFIQRLCAEFGIYWHFEHQDDKHTLIFSDHTAQHTPYPNAHMPHPAYQTLAYYPNSVRTDEEHCDQIRISQHLTPAHYSSRDWDYQRPNGVLSHSDSEDTQTPLEQQHIKEWASDISQGERDAGQNHNSQREIEARGRIRLDALYTPRIQVQASGNLRGIAVGHTLHLNRHPNEQINQEYLILSLSVEAQDIGEESQNAHSQLDGSQSHSDNRQQGFYCRVHFQLHPRNTPYRPAYYDPQTGQPYHPKPRTSGPQSALIVGDTPQGQDGAGQPLAHEIWTDSLGRVKVQFHWDEEGQSNHHSSCWLRVSSGWAGQGFGDIQLPRIGQEVLVDFIGGDPDQPIITGRVYNPEQHTPWALPSNQALSGIKSQELGGSGHNQLIMDDTAGQVQTQLHSSHAQTELNLGYLTRITGHQGRQDYRGSGFELRTDAWGAVRAAQGLLITTQGRAGGSAHQLASEETQSALKQAAQQQQNQHQLASKHQAQSPEDSQAALDMLQQQDQDIKGGGQTQELAQAHLVMHSQGSLLAHSDGQTHLSSAEDTAVSTGGSLLLAQGGSFLASVMKRISLFAHQQGMRLFAAKGKVEIQAQSDALDILAEKVLKIISTQDWVEIVGKKGVLINGGGSYLKLSADGIEQGTTGDWTSYAAKHSMQGGKNKEYEFPPTNDEMFLLMDDKGNPLIDFAYTLTMPDGTTIQGKTNEKGETGRISSWTAVEKLDLT